MSLLEQLFRLLSEPPGSVVYHLVTLFAIQATLAIAWWQWRRLRLIGERDDFAWRLVVACSGLLGLRLLVALIAIFLIGRNDQTLVLRVLPPLEQGLNTLALILLAWSLLPPPASAPRLTNVVAGALLLLTAMLFFSFFRSWWLNTAGAQPYYESVQAVVWDLLQLGITGGALIWLYAVFRTARPLRLALLAVLFIAHLLQALNLPGSLAPAAETDAWVRFGNLVALPILAVIAYRHTLASLVYSQEHVPVDQPERFDLLPGAVRMLEARGPAAVASEAVCFALAEMSADLAAIALLSVEPDSELTVLGCWAGRPRAVKVAGWSLGRWRAIRDAVESQQQIELSLDAPGGDELAEISASLGMADPGALTIAPLTLGNLALGVLVLGYRAGAAVRSAEWQQHFLLCRRFIARVLAHVPLSSGMEGTVRRSEDESDQLAALRRERDEALVEARLMRRELQHSLAPAEDERPRVAGSAAGGSSSSRSGTAPAQLETLRQEIAGLRETIRRTEERLVTEDVADLNLSAAWLLHTIADYAGQLESAWARIDALERSSVLLDREERNQLIASLARTLRTPLTAIYGYSALLATPESDATVAQQAEFLQRIGEDAERMEVLVAQLIQLAAAECGDQTREWVKANDEIEKAISLILSRVRRKHLLLQMDIEPQLPPMSLRHSDLSLIATHLLNNACDASPDGSRVTLNVHVDTAARPVGAQRKAQEAEFLHLEVIDSGSGIQPDDLSRLFRLPDDVEAPAISGIGETNAGLAAAHALVRANGGRIWAGRADDRGSVFSVLLPVTPAAQ